jgi:hypothetical protein
VQEESRLHGHGVYEVDGLQQRGVDIGIGVLVKSDVRVADLNEQRLTREAAVVPIASGQNQVDRSKNAAREREECTGAAEGHALQGLAT